MKYIQYLKERKSIIVLIFYLGKLPWRFDYFTHSCKYNLMVCFYIISDDETYSKTIPTNVVVIHKNRMRSKPILGIMLLMEYPEN